MTQVNVISIAVPEPDVAALKARGANISAICRAALRQALAECIEYEKERGIAGKANTPNTTTINGGTDNVSS